MQAEVGNVGAQECEAGTAEHAQSLAGARCGRKWSASPGLSSSRPWEDGSFIVESVRSYEASGWVGVTGDGGKGLALRMVWGQDG